MITKVGVAGAGTMGSGIALSAALSGYSVVVFDKNKEVLEKASGSITQNLKVLIEKNKISNDDSHNVYSRITFTPDVRECIADIIIEAIIENAESKTGLFNELAVFNSESCIFASNTSSLSI